MRQVNLYEQSALKVLDFLKLQREPWELKSTDSDWNWASEECAVDTDFVIIGRFWIEKEISGRKIQMSRAKEFMKWHKQMPEVYFGFDHE